MANHRASRVREQMQRELGDIVGKLRDPRLGFVTVMDVELSKDLHYATMFISVLGDEQAQRDAVEALEGALGFIRREVAQRIRLRQVPEIAVRYDDTSERAARVNALIDSIPTPLPLEGAGPETVAEEGESQGV